jgi:hypothetical protein
MSETIVCGGRRRMGTPEAPITPAPANTLSSALPRRPPQAVLNEFQDAVTRAENLRRMQNGREVVGIAACVRKLINSEKQKAEHIIAAAALALSQLPLPR